MKFALTRIFLTIAALSLSPTLWADAQPSELYASIAVSPTTGATGTSYNWKLQIYADDAAIGFCRMPDCLVVARASGNQITVLAMGDSRRYTTATETDLATAQSEAVNFCNKIDTNCKVRAYTSASAGVVDSIPKISENIFDIYGGGFDYKIPKFVGFKQLRSNWCWDASIETIYYAATGITLSQSKLANLNFKNELTVSAVGSLDCSKDANTAVCNHVGFAHAALQYLGAAYPEDSYPKTVGASIALLRQSLLANVPVGIEVDWDSGGKHEIVVYGAHFTLTSSPGGDVALNLDFDVYDPFDGKLRTITTGDRYSEGGNTSGGNFDWKMTFANFSQLKKGSPLQTAALPFIDQTKSHP